MSAQYRIRREDRLALFLSPLRGGLLTVLLAGPALALNRLSGGGLNGVKPQALMLFVCGVFIIAPLVQVVLLRQRLGHLVDGAGTHSFLDHSPLSFLNWPDTDSLCERSCLLLMR